MDNITNQTVMKEMFFVLSNIIADSEKYILLFRETLIFDKTLAYIKENPMNEA
jgi:hypothetical protein